uniref:Uncharacterized protein n=1 Tax=Anguilla anguilla TaxID=7936 RepID=A0A0E9WHX6_ANGAN
MSFSRCNLSSATYSYTMQIDSQLVQTGILQVEHTCTFGAIIFTHFSLAHIFITCWQPGKLVFLDSVLLCKNRVNSHLS